MTLTNYLTPNITVPWFKQWFDSLHYHKLYGNRNEKEAESFVNALVSHMNPRQGSTVLDLGCGAGRHARHLALSGFDVTGLDLSSSSIREAKKLAMPLLRFFRHDMRTPFGTQYFDYIFNFFTSFGYFPSQKENSDVVRNISNALKPGGKLVLDYMNLQFAEERLIRYEEKEIDGVNYNITRWSDQQYIFKNIKIDDESGGEPIETTEQVAKFTREDFERMFRQHGLRLIEVFGDYNLNTFNLATSPRLILIASKTI
jgi:SAM-dependent methyltransferase